MLKQLTLAVLSAALLPACILTTDNTSNSNSNSESATITETSGTDGTSNNTVTETSGTSNDVLTTGTSDEPTSSTTAELPTTGEPETVGTTEGTTENATENTTGNSFGMCGWHARMNFYACAEDGGTPGAEDPLGEEAIACAEGLAVGDKCDEENGPVGGLGCCMPNGDLYYCDVQDTNEIVLQVCGA
jgi:hypothetical protein